MFCTSCGKELTGTPEICARCGARPSAGANFCQSCGAPSKAGSQTCDKCGAPLGRSSVPSQSGAYQGISPKSRLATTLLAFFLGEFGAHRFYVGKTGTAVVMLVLTIVGWATCWLIIGFIPLAVVWVWNLIDFIMAVAGKMKDKEGRPIEKW